MKSTWTYKRSLASVGYLLILISMTLLLGRLAVYLKTGASDHSVWYNESFNNHTPIIQWSINPEADGQFPDSIQRKVIGQAYSDAWHAANLYLETGIDEGLRDHFSDSMEAVIQDWERLEGRMVNRVDITHEIQPSLFTVDHRMIVFEDVEVEVLTRITDSDGQIVLDDCAREDHVVVMMLSDGRWRIHHMQRVARSACSWSEDSVSPTSNILLSPEAARSISGVNYYPSQSPWMKFWNEWSSDTIERDFSHIRSNGFNLVRIFIPFEIFGGGRPDENKIVLLGELLDLAHDADLMVIPTLFDFPAGFELSKYPSCLQHVRSIVGTYGNHPAIVAWDLKNEADRDFANHGREPVIQWLEFILRKARHFAPDQTYTVGWSTDKEAHLMAESLDLISFHYYESSKELSSRITALQERVQDKPLMLQEVGMTTYNSPWFPGGRTANEQAVYLQDVLHTLEAAGNIPFAVWTYYDFDEAPASVFGPKIWIRLPQKRYGLYTSNGKAKPAAELFFNPAANTNYEKGLMDRVKPFHISFVIMLLLAAFGFLYARRRYVTN